MAELRQLVAYAFALTIVLFLLTFGVRVSFVEAARYLPLTAPPETNSLNRAAELVSAPAVHVASAQPVWIVPTPKYQYDPKLMIAKSNEDRQKEQKFAGRRNWPAIRLTNVRHSRNAIVTCVKLQNHSRILRNSGDLISKCIPSLFSEASTLVPAHQGLYRYYKKPRDRPHCPRSKRGYPSSECVN